MRTRSRKTILLATDQQQSVLSAFDASEPRSIAYTPYGHRPRENGLLSLLGFNGELPDLLTGHYHLGNGYRQFNPILMRFNSPDSWSPFGEGGLNSYGYCGGDPRNKVDRTGHVPVAVKALLRGVGVMDPPTLKIQLSEAQKNTQRNLSQLIPFDERPPEMFEVLQQIEYGRQRHASNLMISPELTYRRPPPTIQLQSGKWIPARKAYSQFALLHHNKTSTAPLTHNAPKVRFSVTVDKLVEDPVGKWTEVQDIRK